MYSTAMEWNVTWIGLSNDLVSTGSKPITKTKTSKLIFFFSAKGMQVDNVFW